MRIAVLGGGVMGETLASGFLRVLDPKPDIVVVERRAERAAELSAQIDVSIADAAEAVTGADVIVIAVKPQDVVEALSEVGGLLRPGALVVSIAAGIPTARFEEGVADGVSVVRAMPNTPARINLGVTGVSPGARCTAEALALAIQLLESIGTVVEVPESLQDAVTATSGSGPAYVFLLAESMIAAAVDLGLDEASARTMVHGTILGAATLLETSGESAESLRHMVTSPKGTTAAAIATMTELGMREAVASGMKSARDRSRELSGG